MGSGGDRLVLQRSRVADTAWKGLHNRIIICTEEERNGVSSLAFLVVCSVHCGKEEIIGPDGFMLVTPEVNIFVIQHTTCS